MKKIEYRVRPVTRYQITRFHQEDAGAGCETLGVFDNAGMANLVADALAAQHKEGFHLERVNGAWLLTERSDGNA